MSSELGDLDQALSRVGRRAVLERLSGCASDEVVEALERIAARLGYSSALADLVTPDSMSRDLHLLALVLGIEDPLERIGRAHREGFLAGRLAREYR